MTRATPVVSYVTALEDLGYSFRLNEAGDTIEVNGKRLDDFELATIRARMRAEGFSADAVDDIIKMMAAQNRYHPIRSYLISNGMNWDGRSHILTLAAHFLDATTPHKMFEIWLRNGLSAPSRRRWTVVSGTKMPCWCWTAPRALVRARLQNGSARLCPTSYRMTPSTPMTKIAIFDSRRTGYGKWVNWAPPCGARTWRRSRRSFRARWSPCAGRTLGWTWSSQHWRQ